MSTYIRGVVQDHSAVRSPTDCRFKLDTMTEAGVGASHVTRGIAPLPLSTMDTVHNSHYVALATHDHLDDKSG